MPDEIELTPEEEAAFDRVHERIHREARESAAKQAQQNAARQQRTIDQAREAAHQQKKNR